MTQPFSHSWFLLAPNISLALYAQIAVKMFPYFKRSELFNRVEKYLSFSGSRETKPLLAAHYRFAEIAPGEEAIIRDETQIRCAIDAFGRDVYRFAFSQVAETQAAEDIYQEVFEAFFRSDTAFESAAHLKHWLLKTTSNRCKRYFRRRSQNREVPFDPTADYDSRLIAPETNRSGEFHDVWDFVDALPPEQREPIYLYYVEGYSTREIAAITEVAHNTVRTRLRRARLALRAALSKGGTR